MFLSLQNVIKVELEADTDGEEDDTDSEEVELAVIIAGVIRITGVQGSILLGKWDPNILAQLDPSLLGQCYHGLLGLVEFELVESEVELVQHDDIVLVISVVVHSSQQHSLLLVRLLQNECLYITLTHTLIHLT